MKKLFAIFVALAFATSAFAAPAFWPGSVYNWYYDQGTYFLETQHNYANTHWPVVSPQSPPEPRVPTIQQIQSDSPPSLPAIGFSGQSQYFPPSYVGCFPDVAFNTTGIPYYSWNLARQFDISTGYPGLTTGLLGVQPRATMLGQMIPLYNYNYAYFPWEYTTGGLTIESCIASAREYGFTHVLLTGNFTFNRSSNSWISIAGNTCFGYTIPYGGWPSSSYRDETKCNAHCSGAYYEACGARDEYGWFSDTENPNTWQWLSVYSTVDPVACHNTCLGEGYPYSWIEGGNCMCDWYQGP